MAPRGIRRRAQRVGPRATCGRRPAARDLRHAWNLGSVPRFGTGCGISRRRLHAGNQSRRAGCHGTSGGKPSHGKGQGRERENRTTRDQGALEKAREIRPSLDQGQSEPTSEATQRQPNVMTRLVFHLRERVLWNSPANALVQQRHRR